MSNRRILTIAAITLIAVIMVVGAFAPAALADKDDPTDKQCAKWKETADKITDAGKDIPSGLQKQLDKCVSEE